MQTVGIVLLSVGLWITYCGINGVPPIQTLAAIMRSPGEFRQIIADARTAARTKYAALLNAYGAVSGSVASTVARDPFSNYRVSDNWEAHTRRGSGGGTDYVMPVGTPVPTAFGGVVTNLPNNGSGGHTATIAMPDGYKLVYMHLSKFLATNGATVSPGTIVGLSGGAKGMAGAGSSTGPHLHVHMVDPRGTRVSFIGYLTGLKKVT